MDLQLRRSRKELDSVLLAKQDSADKKFGLAVTHNDRFLQAEQAEYAI